MELADVVPIQGSESRSVASFAQNENPKLELSGSEKLDVLSNEAGELED